MLLKIKQFFAKEDGAVTVDWVVLTAAVVGLGLSVILTVSNGATDYATGIGAHLSNLDVVSTY